jgi:hypothetical protein
MRCGDRHTHRLHKRPPLGGFLFRIYGNQLCYMKYSMEHLRDAKPIHKGHYTSTDCVIQPNMILHDYHQILHDSQTLPGTGNETS